MNGEPAAASASLLAMPALLSDSDSKSQEDELRERLLPPVDQALADAEPGGEAPIGHSLYRYRIKDWLSSRNLSKFPLSPCESLVVLALFLFFIIGLTAIYRTMPFVDRKVFKIPRNLIELKALTEYLSVYAADHTSQVLLGYCVTYIFMQTFMIPGTIFMSLLSGALFGEWKGVSLVVFTATTGASCCYLLSKLIGLPIVDCLWPEKLRFFREEVTKRKHKLLYYMLFLRVTPTLPNTFINVASPIVDIPFATFFIATLFGLIPAAFITVRAGLALGELNSLSSLYDYKTLATLFLIGLVSILPTFVDRKS